jgi:hypothetical protein
MSEHDGKLLDNVMVVGRFEPNPLLKSCQQASMRSADVVASPGESVSPIA